MQAVATAIGRDITVAEARNIESRVKESMRLEAAQRPDEWRQMTAAERLQAGAARAAKEIAAEAAKKKQRLQLTIQARDRMERYARSQVSSGTDKNAVRALMRAMAPWYDGRNNISAVTSNAKAMYAVSMGRLYDAWEAIKPGFLGIMANKEAETDLVRALHGDPSAKPQMKAAAKHWAEVTTELRERFNRAGGFIGRLENWGMPHVWSDYVTARIGIESFVTDFMGWIDRSKYRHEDGRPYSDDEMRAFLREAWHTIATNGANKPVESDRPGGLSMKANRGGAHRQIHFRDAVATTDALRKYSGMSVAQAMDAHIRRLTRDIALIEQFGPNADLQVKSLLQTFEQEAAKGGKVLHKDVVAAQHLYDYVAGNRLPPVNYHLANGAAAARAWIRAAFLGSASVTSLITDPGTVMLTARVNGMPQFQVLWRMMKNLVGAGAEEKRIATRAGLMLQTMMAQMDRFGSETLGYQIPDRLASTVFRVTGMNHVSDAYRRAFTTTMLDTVGSLTRRYDSLSKLKDSDGRFLRGRDITDEDWAIWRAATPEEWTPGSTVLTAQAVMAAPGYPLQARERAATKLMAMTFEEQDFAVIEPGARERTWMTAGTESGTVKGEITRSFFLLKAFPISMIAKHWTRALSQPAKSGKAAYVAQLLAAQTILGAVAMGVNDILSGREPTDMTGDGAGKAWLAAFLKGGSLGIYGDFLFSPQTGYGQSALATLLGPAAGAIEDVYDLSIENARQLSAGEEADFGAEAVKFVDRYTPGASIWYVKAALDRMIFQQMQDALNPGYLDRMVARQQRERGTEYWWRPGDTLPQDAPNPAAAIGDQR